MYHNLKIEIPLNSYGTNAVLSAYLKESLDSHVKNSYNPAILLLPFDGKYPNSWEEESIVGELTSCGFQTFILHTHKKMQDDPQTAIMDGFSAIASIRHNASRWVEHPTQIVVCGFSDSGELAVSLMTFWKHSAFSKNLNLTPQDIRPDGGMLVNIPPLKRFHQKGLGNDYQVFDFDTPPLFIWCNSNDPLLVEGPIDFAKAIQYKKSSVELHFRNDVIGQSEEKDTSSYQRDMCLSEWVDETQRWAQNILKNSSTTYKMSNSKEIETNLSIKDNMPVQYYRNIYNDREGMFRHTPFSLEQELVRHVINGDEVAALNSYSKISQQGRKATLASDPLRSYKNSMICYCTFLTRATIQAGVSDEEAFALSDACIQNIETMNEQETIKSYEVTMLLQFISLVNMKQDKNYSMTVKRAIHYITSNLEKPFQLDAVAKYSMVHPNYLVRRFKQETGTTLSRYATICKVREATYFVHHSNYSMAAIAVLYGFSSQSHFASVFKKIMQISPSAYRRGSREFAETTGWKQENKKSKQ